VQKEKETLEKRSKAAAQVDELFLGPILGEPAARPLVADLPKTKSSFPSQRKDEFVNFPDENTSPNINEEIEELINGDLKNARPANNTSPMIKEMAKRPPHHSLSSQPKEQWTTLSRSRDGVSNGASPSRLQATHKPSSAFDQAAQQRKSRWAPTRPPAHPNAPASDVKWQMNLMESCGTLSNSASGSGQPQFNALEQIRRNQEQQR